MSKYSTIHECVTLTIYNVAIEQLPFPATILTSQPQQYTQYRSMMIMRGKEIHRMNRWSSHIRSSGRVYRTEVVLRYWMICSATIRLQINKYLDFSEVLYSHTMSGLSTVQCNKRPNKLPTSIDFLWNMTADDPQIVAPSLAYGSVITQLFQSFCNWSSFYVHLSMLEILSQCNKVIFRSSQLIFLAVKLFTPLLGLQKLKNACV